MDSDKGKTFKFTDNLRTGGVFPERIGHLTMASGFQVQLFFTPNGVEMLVPEQCVENGDVTLVKNVNYGVGFYRPPEEEENDE